MELDKTQGDAVYAILEALVEAGKSLDSETVVRLANAGKSIMCGLVVEDE